MYLIAVAVFFAILAIIIGPYWMLVLRPEDEEGRALKKRLKTPRAAARAAGFVKTREKLSSFAPLDAVLSRSEHLFDPLQVLIARSGLSVSVGTILLASIFAFLAGFALLLQVQSSLLVALAAGLAAAFLPMLFLRWKAQRRLAVFEEQFPEAIDLMARALRAGHALTTALQMTGEEIPDPVGGEFKLVFDQQNYGMSLAEALKQLAARVPLIDARIFVTALLTQRETGGNLSEVLDNIASVIRERFKVKRQVRVMSAHGRITALVLGILPIAVASAIFLISPQQMLVLRDDPAGPSLVTAGVVLQIIGILIIRRIVDVEY